MITPLMGTENNNHHFFISRFIPTFGCDKVSMLIHTYPHKPMTKIKVILCITRLTAHFLYGLMSDLVICKFRKVWSCMTPDVLTESRCH